MLHVRCYIGFMRRKIRVIGVDGSGCSVDYLFGGTAGFLLIGMFYIEFGDVKVLRMQSELG